VTTQSISYKLRSGGPQPQKGDCTTLGQPMPLSSFVLQTFMASKTISEICEDQARFLCSTDMEGLGGEYVSASYTAQRFFDPATKDLVFQSNQVRKDIYIEENEVPGVTNL